MKRPRHSARDLFQLAHDPRSPYCSAMLFCSDGRVNEGRPVHEAAVAANEHGVAIYTLGVGSATAPHDLAVRHVWADEKAFLGDRLHIEATITSEGYQGETARVELVDQESNEIVASKTMLITSSHFAEPVAFTFRCEPDGVS